MNAADPLAPAQPESRGPGERTGDVRRLSIVVLTHNRAHLVGGCLDSLARQVDPGAPLEIVVVDDGSSDGTESVVRERQAVHPRIRYCRRPHGGIAAARNTGIANAGGDVVAIVADDYLLAPDYARTIVSFFRANPLAMIVRFKLAAADDRFLSRVVHAYHEASTHRRLADGDRFAGHAALWRRRRVVESVTADHGLEAAGAAAFRREVFDRVGLFDESFARAEDSDLTARLRVAGIAIHYVPFHLIRHRYDTSLRAVLRTAYRSGRYRWRYYAKHGSPGTSVASLVRLRLASKAATLYWACWRSAQAGSIGRFVAFLPFMVLIEGANKAGVLAEARAARRLARAGRRAARHARSH
jgi:GT2 family glycosyltransferase